MTHTWQAPTRPSADSGLYAAFAACPGRSGYYRGQSPSATDGVVWHGVVFNQVDVPFPCIWICIICCLASLPYVTVQQGARNGRLPFPMSAMVAR